jgi:2-dehydropantoate 2-reductase
MRILVIGAGATGGFFGGRLAQAGRDVTFLVRGRRAEQLRRNGLQIRSPFGDATIQPKLLSADELRAGNERFDLILVATKAYSLEAALDDFAPAVGPETAILPILNGLRQLDILDGRFGAERVLGGSCRIVGDIDSEGLIVQMSKLGDITYGERSRELTPRIEQIDAELRGAAFDAILAPDVLAAMWQKWYVLASMNIICILARGTIGEVTAAPHGAEHARAAVDECVAIATANGYTPAPAPLAAHVTRMTEANSKLTSSMYRDLMKGAPVEADHVLGDLLARGEAHGLSAPLLRAAYVQLKVYEQQRTQS